MKSLFRNTLMSAAAVAFLAPAALAGTGPEVFQANNCNACHTVSAAGIARQANPDEKAKDLSHVGSTRTKQDIARFLLKKIDFEGEKHKKTWTGESADLKTVAEWLESLK